MWVDLFTYNTIVQNFKDTTMDWQIGGGSISFPSSIDFAYRESGYFMSKYVVRE